MLNLCFALLLLLTLATGCDASSSDTLETRRFALDAGADMMANEPPTAADDAVSVDEDGTIVIEPLANDSDPDGDPLTIYAIDSAADGSVTRVDDTFRYDPRPNFHGTDSFSYGVLDGFGGEAVATVTITVLPVNDPPRFTSPTPPQFATLSVAFGEAVEFPLAAADVDEDPLAFGYDPFETTSDPPRVEDDVFRWNPSRDDVGTIPIVVWVDDGTERGARELTIEVAPPADKMCGQYRCGGDDVCVDETCFPACATDVDCSGDATCFDGRCAATACDGRRCADGQSCRLGGCYRICASDAECSPGERCFEDRCAVASCEGVVCAAAEICVGGSCRASCASPDECEAEQGCFAGGCAADVCDGIICPAGQRCESGACAPDCGAEPCGEDGDGPAFEAGGCGGCSSASAIDPAWLLAVALLAMVGLRAR